MQILPDLTVLVQVALFNPEVEAELRGEESAAAVLLRWEPRDRPRFFGLSARIMILLHFLLVANPIKFG